MKKVSRVPSSSLVARLQLLDCSCSTWRRITCSDCSWLLSAVSIARVLQQECLGRPLACARGRRGPLLHMYRACLVFTCIVSVSRSIECAPKTSIAMYRRVSGTVNIDCFDQYRACIEWASGTVTYRYVSGMYRKGQIGCVENGHVFTVFTRIERAKSCVRRKRLYCHVSCMSKLGCRYSQVS